MATHKEKPSLYQPADVDAAASLVAGTHVQLTVDDARRLRCIYTLGMLHHPSPPSQTQDRLAHHATHVQYVLSLSSPPVPHATSPVMYLYVLSLPPPSSRPFSQRITFMDKTTLGQAAVLGIEWVACLCPRYTHTSSPRKGAHLNATQFNWLGTIFYFSYLLFQYPQNLALQRFPVGKWMRYSASSLSPAPLTALQASTSSAGQSSSAAMRLAPLLAPFLPYAFSSVSVKVLSPLDS